MASHPELKAIVLEQLEDGATYIEAAAMIGVSNATLSMWRAKDPDFSAACARAYMAGLEALENEAVRRGARGTDEPVWHQGRCVGYVKKYSDTLLIFTLKARDPLRYCDKARTAAMIRAWAKQDAEDATKSGVAVSPNVMDILETVAQWKRAQPPDPATT